eukprot:GFYU01004775.1.p1 GENE.GFYU01004775.1~~GFYU01004775.1.p1  ORF type:complete len:229 (+),score=74.00 GFYU01004775.1:100-786(+)
MTLSLNLNGRNLTCIPGYLAEKHRKVTSLDLSNNKLINMDALASFTYLTDLILDKNGLQDLSACPIVPSVQTLWVNNNDINDLDKFLATLTDKFPNVHYLSMFNNPAAPDPFAGKDADDYKRYRYFVISKVRSLKFLDSAGITDEERVEAYRVGKFMVVAKPDFKQYHRAQSEPNVKKVLEDEEKEGALEDPRRQSAVGEHFSYFGIRRFEYIGRESEGNRYIKNEHL